MIDSNNIISELKSKNELALRILYQDYSGALYGVILRICKHENLAQEVLQDTFLTIWNKVEQYDPSKAKFYTWAYRIARNKALNAIRSKKNVIQEEDFGVYKDEGDEQVDQEGLQISLKELDEHHRKAIELVYFQGLTHREAHEVMNVPLGTFKSYIKQAIRELRKNYDKAFVFLFLLEVIK